MNEVVALAELGKESRAEEGERGDAGEADEGRGDAYRSGAIHRPLEDPRVSCLEPAQGGGLMRGAVVTAEHEQGHRRSDRECHRQRGERREDVGQTERPKERPMYSRERQHGCEHEDHDEGGVHHTAADLDRGVEDDARRRSR